MRELRNQALNRKRKIKQLRFDGYDGRVYKDIDYEHQDDGTHVFPHTHRWNWDVNPPREK